MALYKIGFLVEILKTVAEKFIVYQKIKFNYNDMSIIFLASTVMLIINLLIKYLVERVSFYKIVGCLWVLYILNMMFSIDY